MEVGWGDAPRWMYKRARRLVLNPPGGRLAMTVPRTLGFMMKTWDRGQRVPVYPDPPAARPTAGLAAQVAMDEVILAVMKSPRRYPRRLDYERVGSEVMDAVALYTERGWLADPRSYHGAPTPAVATRQSLGSARGVTYERIDFDSGYAPWPDEPGRDRWMSYEPNRTASVVLVRHEEPNDRPWLVCVHGFATGSPGMDFPAFRAARLHRDLGLNLAFPVLPMHGPRKVGRFSGTQMMSFDMLDTVHGLAQAAWDVRKTIAAIRANHPGAPIGLFGMSLGGYVVSLTASLEPGLDAVVAAIPAVDLPALFAHHCPPNLRKRAIENNLLGEPVQKVHRVVSPLALQPLVAKDRRFVVAGIGDRMSTPKQAYRLWQHWDQPAMAWFAGNHIGFFWSKDADRFVLDALRTSGLALDEAITTHV